MAQEVLNGQLDLNMVEKDIARSHRFGKMPFICLLQKVQIKRPKNSMVTTINTEVKTAKHKARAETHSPALSVIIRLLEDMLKWW